MNQDIIIKLKKVSKKVKKKTILHPLSYQLERGKVLALCGGNGAGKSSLIRMLTGLTKPTSGSIYLNGYQSKQKKEYLQQFSYMPDYFQFHPALTAQETISFYASLQGVSLEKSIEVIRDLGLEGVLDQRVSTFSKGMNQRLLLAQALIAESELIILDEPTNGLDPYWIHHFSELILEAKSKGQTVVLSTHDLHVAERIADEVIFLHEGRVLESGPMEAYKDRGLYRAFEQLYFEFFEQKK